MTLVAVLRRMGVNAVPHGFRSTFRDWAAEQTSFPHEVCEMALAHTISNKAEAAYRRGDLFEKRRGARAGRVRNRRLRPGRLRPAILRLARLLCRPFYPRNGQRKPRLGQPPDRDWWD